MYIFVPCLAAILLSVVFTTPVNAQQDEEGPDIRGEWNADIVPSTKELFVTDCPCESYTQMIEISCKPKSGTAHINLNDFITEKAKVGEEIKVTYDVDGKTLERDAVMAAFSGNEMRPGFDAEITDPLFAAIASGRTLKMSSAGRTVTSPLKGSKKAMQKLVDYCGK
jgi:hypothetical protein